MPYKSMKNIQTNVKWMLLFCALRMDPVAVGVFLSLTVILEDGGNTHGYD